VENPKPDPKSAPLRLPPPETYAEKPLSAKGLGLPLGPAFRMRLPKPAWWKRPGVWIAPLLVLLGVLVALVSPLLHRDHLPPVDARFPTIVIDAGHGGQDSGATGNGLVEKNLTLDTAIRLERQLRLRGFAVVLTRRDDTFIDLYERPEVANALPNPLFVSLHFNDNTTASGDGVETFYSAAQIGSVPVSLSPDATPAPPTPSAQFAQCMQASLVGLLGVTDRGAKPRQLAVVRCARCPAVLVEGGFINNPNEARLLALPEYRERIAIAVAEGVVAYQKQRTQPPAAASPLTTVAHTP
jgi:N-acetylmuramoyl-L-alanine amidase